MKSQKRKKIQHIRTVNSYLTLKKIEVESRANEEQASSVSGYTRRVLFVAIGKNGKNLLIILIFVI